MGFYDPWPYSSQAARPAAPASALDKLGNLAMGTRVRVIARGFYNGGGWSAYAGTVGTVSGTAGRAGYGGTFLHVVTVDNLTFYGKPCGARGDLAMWPSELQVIAPCGFEEG